MPQARHAPCALDDEESSLRLWPVQPLSSAWGSAPTGGGTPVGFDLPVPAALDA
ncbi:hypothetical protein [Nonomuraea polychroma]|uniref:hypothetical protein n=1 Tax=Nonomuraea polychroma TaxID=46176 RepID=UPI0013E40286|nr:hypothetical protein [Nonomuraea polychroma]